MLVFRTSNDSVFSESEDTWQSARATHDERFSHGWELAQRMTAVRPELPVLYITGYSDEEARRFGKFDVGAQFLQKPFRPDAFLGKTREILDAKKRPA